jgi:putative NADH-flavin reductase
LKIIVFGGTGRVGRVVLDRALSDNHIVTIFVGNISKLTVRRENLRIHAGDVFNSQAVRDAIRVRMP